MTRKKHETPDTDDAALATEAARIEAKNALDDSGAVESAALSDVAATGADVDAVAETAPEPPPAWVTAARVVCERATDANAAWHDFFKAPLPDKPAAQWTGADANYGYYEGGRMLVVYPSGFFAIMTTPSLEKPAPVARRR